MGKIKVSELFDIEKGTLQSSKNISGEYDFVTASSEWKTHESYSHECEALIFAMGASGSLGRTHYVNGKFIASDLCFILTPKEEYKNRLELKLYYHYFNFNREDIVDKTATGTSKKAINITNFSNLEIDYIENQKEVLRKIESALPISNELKSLNERNTYLIEVLKRNILDKAIQGELLSQNYNEKPSLQILEEIEKERQEKKNKKEKSIREIDRDDLAFELPDGWEWIRFGEIIKSSRYGTSKKTDYSTKGVAVLRIPNVSKGYLELDDIKFGSLTDKEKNELSLEKDDLILVRSNGSSKIVGKSILIEENLEDFAFAGYLVRVKLFNDKVYAPFINMAINSNLVRSQIEPYLRTTTGVKNINTKEIHNLLIPFPPYEEQIRIYERVRYLHGYYEELKNHVSKAEKEIENIMKVVLKETFR